MSVRTYSTKFPADTLSAPEAEMGILGSCLISPQDSISKCVENIKPDYFFTPSHKTIYEALIHVWNENTRIDLITFTQVLRDRNLLDQVGGVSFVTSLFTFVPSASNIDYYISIVTDRYVLREVIAACEHGLEKAKASPDEAQLLISDLQSKLLDASEGHSIEKKTIQDYAHDALESLEEAHRLHGQLPGFSTGLIDLDRQTGGLREGQLIVISGETGGGKTALALKIAKHNAIDNGISTGFISLEMSGEELSERLIAMTGKVDLHTFVTSGGSERDMPKISNAVTKVSSSPLHICDESDMDFSKMRAVGREMKRQHDIKILVVDYIQLLSAGTGDENREQVVAASAASLKQMAKELNVVVVALSQLNDDGRLRESRAIGHHSDKVIKIRHDRTERGVVYFDIEKNRKGPTGSVSAVFIPQFTDFENRARMVEF